jgi:hypothetical protein
MLLGPDVLDGDVGEAARLAGPADERALAARGFDEYDASVGTRDREREAREARARPHVRQGFRFADGRKLERDERVGKVVVDGPQAVPDGRRCVRVVDEMIEQDRQPPYGGLVEVVPGCEGGDLIVDAPHSF